MNYQHDGLMTVVSEDEGEEAGLVEKLIVSRGALLSILWRRGFPRLLGNHKIISVQVAKFENIP